MKVQEHLKLYWAYYLLALILLLRLLSLGATPLLDSTEARYASVSQNILRFNDWVFLRFPPFDEHFQCKPPLQFWLMAFSFLGLGVNAFAARLPNFLLGLPWLWLTYLYARQLRFSHQTALYSLLLLASSLYFVLETGTVSLDPLVSLLVLSAALLFELKAGWRRDLLLGLVFGLALITKGLTVPVLVLGPFVLQSWFSRAGLVGLFRLNWFLVAAISLAIALPWFLLVERQAPGYLQYFFLNEHFGRFLNTSYGDKCGNPHVRPFGSALLYAPFICLPWSVLWLGAFKLKLNASLVKALVWALFPILFFCFARSLLESYVLPSLSFLAIITAFLARRLLSHKLQKPFFLLTLILPAVLFVFFVFGSAELSVQRSALHKIPEVAQYLRDGKTILFEGNPPYSFFFYTRALSIPEGWKRITDEDFPPKEDQLVWIEGYALNEAGILVKKKRAVTLMRF